MTATKVYRNGSVSLNKRYAGITAEWETFDALKPAGRSGRIDSIYASPSLLGLLRWVQAAYSSQSLRPEPKPDLSNNEITIADPGNIYVYNVSTYEDISRKMFPPKEFETEEILRLRDLAIQSYWDSGIRLSDWDATALKGNLNAMDWEVLVPIKSILSSRQIENHILLEEAPEPMKSNLQNFLKI